MFTICRDMVYPDGGDSGMHAALHFSSGYIFMIVFQIFIFIPLCSTHISAYCSRGLAFFPPSDSQGCHYVITSLIPTTPHINPHGIHNQEKKRPMPIVVYILEVSTLNVLAKRIRVGKKGHGNISRGSVHNFKYKAINVCRQVPALAFPIQPCN